MKILVVNPGSSTIKFNIFEMSLDNIKSVLRGVASNINAQNSLLKLMVDKIQSVESIDFENHAHAIKEFMCRAEKIIRINDIDCVAFRVVHGGGYTQVQDVATTKENIFSIAKRFTKAHVDSLIETVEYFALQYPKKPMYFDFDTLYHIKYLQPEQYTYALPQDKCKELGIRKYGEHGLSHHYIASRSVKLFGLNQAVISCHLGSGSSISAIYNGECIDNSMGLTPIAGVVMATRCGNIDPSTITYMMKEYNLSPDQMDEIMNLHSGLKALCGDADMKKVIEKMQNGDSQAELAFKVAINSYIKSIGSRILQLGDKIKPNFSNLKIVFTAGIGENASLVREKVCEKFAYLGVKIDKNANDNYAGGDCKISSNSSGAEVWILPTNEELIVAQDVYKYLKNNG